MPRPSASDADKKRKKAEYDRRRRETHRVQIREYQREYVAKNKEKISQQGRSSELRRTYGISLEDYESLLASQNFSCAVCGSPPSGKALSVDHCHETNAVRGLLCQPCNMALGLFKDNTASLQRAIDYLSAAQSKDTQH